MGKIVGAVCQWHTFSTDRSGYRDAKYRTIRKAFLNLAQEAGGGRMNRALLRTLEKITEEEREILKGRQIETERYTTKETLITIESRKMLEEGRLITVRPHTRFVYFPKHNHNYIEVFYVCKGEVTHIIGKERVTVSAGEILFLNQYVSHEILPSGKEDIGINLIVLPEFFDTAFEMIGKDNMLADFIVSALREKNGVSQYLYFQVAGEIQIQNLMENLIYSLVNRQNFENQINQVTMGLLFLNLLNVSKSMKSSSSSENSYQDMISMIALKYVEQNYKTGTLTELSEMVNLSMSGLSRLIRQNTGHTFKELLQRKRFNKAVELLVDTDLSVGDILAAVGYENSSYFYRKFMEREQMTPREYRNLHKEEKLIHL